MLIRSGCLLLLLSVLALAGCRSNAPYYLIESRLVQSDRQVGDPDVTETPIFRAMGGGVRKLGLQPPDVCADQGASGSGGEGQLQLGVLRTRCGVEMAALERALVRAGYEVVSWGAVSHMASKQEIPVLEAAAKLGMDALIQVNALERIDIQPGRDARFERRFFHATRSGERTEAARVPTSRRGEFESLIEPKEAKLVGDKRVGATINVSVIWVSTGATMWFYEWTQVDDITIEPLVEVLADCDDKGCRELRKPAVVSSDGLVAGSIAGVSLAGDPADESQAIFQDLVRALVTDLAERFAGRRS